MEQSLSEHTCQMSALRDEHEQRVEASRSELSLNYEESLSQSEAAHQAELTTKLDELRAQLGAEFEMEIQSAKEELDKLQAEYSEYKSGMQVHVCTV